MARIMHGCSSREIPQAPCASSTAFTRREFLWRYGGGLGGLALVHLLGQAGALGQSAARNPDFAGGLHHRARARRVIQLFMSGAASQCDMFDYKPELIRRHGAKFDPGGKIELFQSDPGACFKSPWDWKRYGSCQKWMSDLVPELGSCVDDIAFVHSMVSKSNVHGPATYLQNSGFLFPGFPHMGAWISYGLGNMNDNLPAFVVLPDARGFAPNGPANWGAGFLPASHQGTMVRPGSSTPIFDLFPPVTAKFISPASEAEGRQLLQTLNREHLREHPADSRLEARIAAFELAAKLQTSAPEVLDISQETPATRKLYGLDDPITEDFGRRCLIARRLVERDVRFVQVWSGADNGFPRRNWDSHEDIAKDHGEMGRSMDRPAAALIKDLKARGLLADTLVLWTTEFGRMPCSQGSKGRDHNPFAFTNWLAGGGIKGGTSYGVTDEWSYKVAEGAADVHDIHATILHQLGIDHTQLTFRQDGIDRRLTDVHGHVITRLIDS